MSANVIERPARIVVVRGGDCPASQRADGIGSSRPGRPSRGASTSLSERGKAQADAAASWLAANEPDFDAVFVSPWTRAAETLDRVLAAQPPNEQHRLVAQCRVDERLRDRDLGITAAMDYWEIAAKYPDEVRRLALDGPYYYRPVGGESWADVSLRCFSILNTMFRDRAEQRVLVVTHGIVALSLRKILERLDDKQVIRLAREAPPAPGSITRYEPLPRQAEAGRMSTVDWAIVPYGPELASPDAGVEQVEPVLEPMDTN